MKQPWSRRRRRAPGRSKAATGLLVLAGLALLCAPLLLRNEQGFDAEAAQAPTTAPISARDIRVIDGDTIERLSTGERIRLVNIDTAELGEGAACSAERAHAQAARSRLRSIVRQGDGVVLERTGSDAFGRTLAHVRIDGADAGQALVAEGLARPWGGRREPWCSTDGRLRR